MNKNQEKEFWFSKGLTHIRKSRLRGFLDNFFFFPIRSFLISNPFKNIVSKVIPQRAVTPVYVGEFFTLLTGARGLTLFDISFKTLNLKCEAVKLKTHYINPGFASMMRPSLTR